jgi:K+-transporting ATPase KdpC subunit
MNRMNGPSLNQPSPETPVDQRRAGFISQLLGHLKISAIATIVLAIIVSGVYPTVVWALATIIFHQKAGGSLIGKDGQPVNDDKDAIGSTLIGQSFSDAKYFHSRPSGAGNGYDATASGGSNLGPTSAKLMYGTTKNVAYTVFAADKSHTAVVPVAGRVQAIVAEVSKTTISVMPAGAPAGTKTLYTLDPAVADPNTVVNFHGRTIHAITIPLGTIVELKLSDKTPLTVTAINAADQEIDGGISGVDTTANKITLNDASSTVITVDPKNTVFVVNGKADAKLDGVTTDMTLHAVVSVQMDYDGIADRVIHYCQDNKIDYKSSVPDSAFTDADGVDDEKLVAAFNAASSPTITPDANKPIPADAVTASGSGLDPHISTANAMLQAPRVADARKVPVEKVQDLIGQYTEGPSLGFLGEAGVNVLRVNLALDQVAPASTAAAPAPTTQPTSP